MSIVTPKGHGLGLIPTPEHPSQPRYALPEVGTLPVRTTNRQQYAPPVRDQGSQGACTGFATTSCAYGVYKREGYHNPFVPSPAFQYYNSREIEGTTNQDSGSTITDAASALAKYGMTAESNCPYNPSIYTVAPTNFAYANASKHLAVQIQRVPQTLEALKSALVAKDFIILGVSVYASFEDASTAQTGLVPIPAPGEQFLGGHAQVVFDYDDTIIAADGTKGVFITENSWGTGFGQQGYLLFPYAYILNATLTSDLWTLVKQQ